MSLFLLQIRGLLLDPILRLSFGGRLPLQILDRISATPL
jgi:hypothetical protein